MHFYYFLNKPLLINSVVCLSVSILTIQGCKTCSKDNKFQQSCMLLAYVGTVVIYMYLLYHVGMIGAMVRHLKSLRLMTRDHGWIHTLLEEAENERMHLLTALELKKPGPVFKLAVIGMQGEIENSQELGYLKC